MISTRRSEEGTTLILVLVFLVAIGPILAALVSLSGSNLLSTSNLAVQRNLEFGADSYMDAAVQAVRYSSPTATACQTSSHPEVTPAFPSGIAPSAYLPDSQSLSVWCYMGTLQGFYGRNVEFDVCATSYTSFGACQSNPVLRAQVVYNDETSSGTCHTLPLDATCYGNGTSVTIVTWTLKTATH